jgi:methyl-accepting chemotaxis protein
MILLNSLAMAFFQDAASSAHDVHLMRLYVAFIAGALMLQALGILLVAIYAAKFLAVLHSISRNVEEKALPLITRTGDLVRDLSPKITAIGTNVEQVSYTMRAKVDELGETVSQLNKTVTEANSRTRVHVARVDNMVSEALDTTEDVSRTVQQGIRVPVREIAAIIAGVKVAVETLIERSPFGKRKQDF